MNIEDEITVKAGLRTTKVLVEFSPDGTGGWVLQKLFTTGDSGDMDMLECERSFGSIANLARHVEAAIYDKPGQIREVMAVSRKSFSGGAVGGGTPTAPNHNPPIREVNHG